jgi:hypothetical protein
LLPSISAHLISISALITHQGFPLNLIFTTTTPTTSSSFVSIPINIFISLNKHS